MLKFAKDKNIKIGDLLNEKKYPVDKNYQREPGAWSREDEQFFIDSLLKKIKIPKIYLHKKRNKYWIIDGQQRIETIRFFINGKEGKKLKLDSDITEKKKDILGFGGLTKNEQKVLLNYTISSSIIERGNDNEIRDLFRRLQRGKPLTEGERLNAMRGNIVKLMRDLTDHKFFKKSLMSQDKRHKFYHIAAVFLYTEDKIDNTTFGNIEKFFGQHASMKEKDKVFRNCWRNLNFLSKCYKHNELPSSGLGWLTSVYLFISDLRSYGLLGQCNYGDIHNYLENFYIHVYHDEKRKGDYREFYDAVHAGTNNKGNIIQRREILIKYFKGRFNVHLKDENRLFSSEKDKKIVYHNANGKCQYPNCSAKNKSIKFNEPFQIHHKKMDAAGGKKEYKNAWLVHPDCHYDIHRKMKLKRIK